MQETTYLPSFSPSLLDRKVPETRGRALLWLVHDALESISFPVRRELGEDLYLYPSSYPRRPQWFSHPGMIPSHTECS